MEDKFQQNIKNQEKNMNKEKGIEIPKVKTMSNRKTGTHEEWPCKVVHRASKVAAGQRRYL
jgi:hypothetical protein